MVSAFSSISRRDATLISSWEEMRTVVLGAANPLTSPPPRRRESTLIGSWNQMLDTMRKDVSTDAATPSRREATLIGSWEHMQAVIRKDSATPRRRESRRHEATLIGSWEQMQAAMLNNSTQPLTHSHRESTLIGSWEKMLDIIVNSCETSQAPRTGAIAQQNRRRATIVGSRKEFVAYEKTCCSSADLNVAVRADLNDAELTEMKEACLRIQRAEQELEAWQLKTCGAPMASSFTV